MGNENQCGTCIYCTQTITSVNEKQMGVCSLPTYDNNPPKLVDWVKDGCSKYSKYSSYVDDEIGEKCSLCSNFNYYCNLVSLEGLKNPKIGGLFTSHCNLRNEEFIDLSNQISIPKAKYNF